MMIEEPEQDVIMEDVTSTTSYVTPQRSPIVNNTAVPSSSTATPAFQQTTHLSFRELMDLLEMARQNKAIYQQNHGKVFAVQLRQKEESHLYFNIDKLSKRNHKKEKKGEKVGNDWPISCLIQSSCCIRRSPFSMQYEYALHANFTGPSENEGYICCAISSSVLEPYFGLSPVSDAVKSTI
jgi:hypothetical protein